MRIRKMSAPSIHAQPRALYRSVLLEHELGKDPLIASLEDRMARLTGIPAHKDESPLRLSLNMPWDKSSKLHLQNLHHDTAKGAERRVATILMYLSDGVSDSLRGGGTLLPCIGRADSKGPSRSTADTCSRLVHAFERGDKFLNPPGGIYNDRCFDVVCFLLALNS